MSKFGLELRDPAGPEQDIVWRTCALCAEGWPGCGFSSHVSLSLPITFHLETHLETTRQPSVVAAGA